MDKVAQLKRQSGFGMLEVLVSVVILLVGVLGLAGLISRSQQAEMESYQRAQALVLLQDMVGRINANRKNAVSYLGTYAPTTETSTCPTTSTVVTDLCQWKNALLGAAEKSGTSNIGAMIGARGCINELDAANRIYMVSVAWQGMGKTFAPTDSPACGANAYGAEDQRRVVTATLKIARLYP